MGKTCHWLDSLIGKLNRGESGQVGYIPGALLNPPSQVDVINGFRLILGQELTDDSAISARLRHRNIAESRLNLLNSGEFLEKFQFKRPGWRDHPDFSRGRDTLIFIHLQETPAA